MLELRKKEKIKHSNKPSKKDKGKHMRTKS